MAAKAAARALGRPEPAVTKAISKAEERYAPTNRPDGLDVVTISADAASRDPDRPQPDNDLLDVLGLTDGLYEPGSRGGRRRDRALPAARRREVVNTPDFALALENMRYVRRRHAISLFFGDPGVGKTIAARRSRTPWPRGRAVSSSSRRPNPRMLANAILERLPASFMTRRAGMLRAR